MLLNRVVKINIKWDIVGHENYCFAEDKNMYNTKTGKLIKHTLNNRAKGWWIGKKFFTHNNLKPLLVKHKEDYCPF